MRKLFIYSIILFVLLLVAGCSTEKNKWLNKGYHRMTARYNGYFNANEKINESMTTFRSQYKDDYTKILPIYIYADEETSASLNSDMDKAIEKTSRVIKRHSMPNREKNPNKKDEWNNWIDDNWLLMGQAYFYKRSFDEALTRFEYCYNAYKESLIFYDAQLWMARTYLEKGNMIESQRWLDKLDAKQKEDEEKAKSKNDKTAKNSKTTKSKSKSKSTKSKSINSSKSKKPASAKKETPPFPKYLIADLAATYADYYIRKKDYDKAIEQLEKAIKHTKKKRVKARYVFILAQLYQEKGRNDQATDSYAAVLKLNPTFEMEFYSRINRALLYSGGDSKGLRAELMKLLKDAKNKDYYDQIYYALAEIEFKQPNREQGITYLQKSVETSVSNNKQKGKSYLRLGEVYFDDRIYVKAKNYYDSAIALLPIDWPRYDKIKEKSLGLTELVAHLENIRVQDSLLRLSSLSNKDLEKYVTDILRKQKEEEQRKKEEQEAKELLEQNKPTIANNNFNTGGTGWYFYNQQLMGSGFNDFKKVWGTRKLEDDWRRKDKTSISEEMMMNTPAEINTADPLAVSEKEIEAYMKNVPRGPDAIATANEKIIESLYKSGVIFKDNLVQYDLAAKQFKELIKRFPDSEQTLPTYYQLYMLYNKTGNSERETYKNIILTDYPNSEYAKIIRDPNYRKNEELVKAEQEKKYTQVYRNYAQKNWQEVLISCNEVIEKENDNHFIARYYFLRALTFGQLKDKDKFKISLSETAQKFAKEEIGKEAANLLEFYKEQESKEEALSGKKVYIYDPNAEHFFIYLFPNGKGSINEAKNNISDFNSHYFSLKQYNITNNFLDTENQLIIVKPFDNKDKAMEYYIAFKNDKIKLKDLNNNADYYIISAANYANFFLEKKPEDYKIFFEDNYKK